MSPLLGVLFHWIGGFAAGSFYLPYKAVRRWSWETYWLVGGFFAWIVCPWAFALGLTRDLGGVLGQQSVATLGWTYFLGVLWGVGGLTFGLTMRYLGLSLGMGVALGFCAAFGTLLPPLGKAFFPGIPVPETLGQIASTLAGRITLLGVALCLLGIGICALAGLRKDREMPVAEKQKAIAEFAFGKGIVVAAFAGIMSACFAFALAAGNPIGDAAIAAGTDPIWTGLPKLTVVLLGGFTTNFVWCVFLNFRHRSYRDYVRLRDDASGLPPPAAGVARNYGWCALAGGTWYLQFFFYTMGETKMGAFGFASWSLHMASIIIFSTVWGWVLHEWKGSSRKVHGLIGAGIATLILSTVVIGAGTYLKADQAETSAPSQGH